VTLEASGVAGRWQGGAERRCELLLHALTDRARERRPSRAVPCLEARGVEGSPVNRPEKQSQPEGDQSAPEAPSRAERWALAWGLRKFWAHSMRSTASRAQAMGALGTRRSVRPLCEEGGRNAHTSGAQARRERDRVSFRNDGAV
jgi:hypothetical protein